MGRDALISREVLDILWIVWDVPQTTKSTLAKERADEFAIAACAGLITVQVGARFGRVWRITTDGLGLLVAALDTIDDDRSSEEIRGDAETLNHDKRH